MGSVVFFHITFNPVDSTSHNIQTIFKQTMLTENDNCTTLLTIANRADKSMNINRLVVAYSTQKYIEKLVFPRKFELSTGPNIFSNFEDEKFKSLIKSKK